MASSQAIDGYQHDRLASPTSQIRLLRFNASDDTYLLSGSLEIHDLSEYRPYVALSYEWGESENQVEIIIDGKIFWIRHNGMSQGAQFEGLSAGDTIRLWRRRAYN
jgi:hypothetical protein